MEIKNILIANRGEIAVRISRAARELGISTLAVFSDVDGPDAYHCRVADRAIPLNGRELHKTYLDIEKIISLAKQNDVQAIHPGYGFLSENHLFARTCEENNLIFIGPDSELIRMMGNKIEARARVAELGIPVITAELSTGKKLMDKVHKLEYPLLIKAAAGGGGKGMRIVDNANDLPSAIETTSREARSYFGNGEIFLEKYINPARHIEFQVLGDLHGNVVHVNERECSVQRRYQKIIEESPALWLKTETREKMGEAALRITKELGYTSAGTIEFLVDEEQQFYFLEMNTRIQVEHPVTEMVTGIDLVKEQIRMAQGKHLSIRQKDIQSHGHAIETRIYAEDPSNKFMPSPGKVALYKEPSGDFIRIDSSLDGPTNIFPDYDPMIAKLIVWGPDRDETIQRMRKALKATSVLGIETNLNLLTEIILDEEYINNRISTKYCDERLEFLISNIRGKKENSDKQLYIASFLAATFLSNFPPKDNNRVNSPWNTVGYWRQCSRFRFSINGEPIEVSLDFTLPGSLKYQNGDSEGDGSLHEISKVHNKEGALDFLLNGKPEKAFYIRLPDSTEIIDIQGIRFEFKRWDDLPEEPAILDTSDSFEHNNFLIVSPMFGKIVKVNVRENDDVKIGDVLIIIDSMKIENNIIAARTGKVGQIFVKAGEQVEVNKPLLLIE